MKTNRKIKLEQLKLLYGSLLSSQVGMFLTGVVLVFLLKEVIAKELLIMWFLLLSLTVFFRLTIRQIFFTQLVEKTIDLKKANKRFLLGVIFSGLVWGSSSIILYPTDSPVHQAYLGLILLGIVAASIGTLSPNKSAFTSFLLATTLPLIFQSAIGKTQLESAFTILIIIFSIFSFNSARRFNKSIVRSIQLKFEAKKRAVDLQNQEKKYRLLFEKSADPMLLISNFNLLLANKAAVKLLGYKSIEHLLTADQFDLSPYMQPDGSPSNIAAIQITQQLKEFGFHHSKWTYKRFDGQVKPSEITSTIVPFEGKKAVYCIIRDTSSIKQTEHD